MDSPLATIASALRTEAQFTEVSTYLLSKKKWSVVFNF